MRAFHLFESNLLTMAGPTHVLSADDRDRITRLHWYAKSVVQGLTVGMHRSPHKGSSIEFKEHRAYVRGDEIRLIDWKLFGKTDRLYIKQFEDETNLRATVILDQSRSMAYQGEKSSCSKHDFAVRLAASLGYLFVGQQDAVGLATFDTQVRDYLPPKSTPNHLQALIETMAQSQCAGETSIAEVLRLLAPKIKRRGVVILISDCFDNTTLLLKALSVLRQLGNQVVLFQIWDPDELTFPFRKRTEFQSLENPAGKQMLDPNRIRQAYLKNLATFRQQLGDGCAKQQIPLVTCDSSQSHTKILAQLIGGEIGGTAAITGAGKS